MRPLNIQKVLVAYEPEKNTKETFSYCKTGELVMWPLIDNNQLPQYFVGIETRSACTNAKVMEVDMATGTLEHLIKDSYSQAGFAAWFTYGEFIKECEKEAARILRIAKRFESGTIVARTGNAVQEIIKQTYVPKCKTCDMPKPIKAQNTSIKDNTGLCSMCYRVKDMVEQGIESR